MSLLQLGDFLFRWGEVFYEWTNESVNLRSDDNKSGTAAACVGEEAEEKANVESIDLTYRVWFPGGCTLAHAQAVRDRLWDEIDKAPSVMLRRQIVDDALLEEFNVNKGSLTHTDFRFQLTRKRTLTMQLELNVKFPDALVILAIPGGATQVFPGVTRDASLSQEAGGSQIVGTFPGVTRVES